jgi:hypothetical protein
LVRGDDQLWHANGDRCGLLWRTTSADKIVIRNRGTGRHNALRYGCLVPRRCRPNSVHYQSGERSSANCILGILSTGTSVRPSDRPQSITVLSVQDILATEPGCEPFMSAFAIHTATPSCSVIALSRQGITGSWWRKKTSSLLEELETTRALQSRQLVLSADRDPARLRVPICNGVCCPLFPRRLCIATAGSGQLLQEREVETTSPGLGIVSKPHQFLDGLRIDQRIVNIPRINALVLCKYRQSVFVSCRADTREASTCQRITASYSSSPNNIIQVFNHVFETLRQRER